MEMYVITLSGQAHTVKELLFKSVRVGPATGELESFTTFDALK
jgi:hypothetical protein